MRYFKIEVPGAAAKLRALIQLGGAAIEGPFDGEESITLLPDLDAGATGTMPSSLLPEALGQVVALYRAGRRPEAIALYDLSAAGTDTSRTLGPRIIDAHRGCTA